MQAIESVMEKYARVMARKAGVTARPGDCFKTDGKTIWYVPIRDSDDPYIVLQSKTGFRHEAKHGRYTDFNLARTTSRALHSVKNAVEDARIEKLGDKEWPGHKKQDEKFLTEFVAREWNTRVHKASNFKIILDMLYLRLTEMRMGTDLGLVVPDKMAKLFEEKCGDFLVPLFKTDDQAETMAIAEKIYNRLKDVDPPAPQPQPQPQPQKGQTDESEDGEDDSASGEQSQEGSEDQDGDNAGDQPEAQRTDEEDGLDEEGNSGEGAGSGDDESDGGAEEESSEGGEGGDSDDGDDDSGPDGGSGSSEEGEVDESKDENAEAGSDQQDGEADEGSGDSDDTKDGDTGNSGDAGSNGGGSEEEDDLEDERKDLAEEVEQDKEESTLNDDLQDSVNEYADRHGIYRDAPGTKDKIHRQPAHIGARDEVRRYERAGRKMVGVNGAQLRRFFISSRAPKVARYQTSGRLDNGRLWAMDTDTVFRKKLPGWDDSAAVSFVIDNSSSMGNWGADPLRGLGDIEPDGKWFQASALMAYLAQQLDRLNIPFEAVGFSTLESTPGVSLDSNGLRHGGIFLNLVKTFEESYGAVKHRFTWPTQYSRGTVELPAIHFAGERLKRREEENKIFFILSDGESSGGDKLKREMEAYVQDLLFRGVKVVGVGIESDAISHYVPDTIVVQGVDLARDFYKKLSGILMKTRR